MNQELLRRIPKIDTLLQGLEALGPLRSRQEAKEKAQARLRSLREGILRGEVQALPEPEELIRDLRRELEEETGNHLRRVINATGVVLHTNLGRAPLGEGAARVLEEAARGYCNLEYDIEAGRRGSRYDHVEALLCRLTGAEAAMVVNNNAGAVFLMLNTLARGVQVAISRGELVEIGGSFRVPEIMERSGALLQEVGTTNKTHPEDYEQAIEAGAGVLLKVHTSNFAIEGFTESVSVRTLARIGKARGVPVLYDLGACFLLPRERLGLHQGESARQALEEGADLICFSGDKLMGSAQGGILAGRRELIDRIRKNHLTRMLRIDKLSLAVLEETLRTMTDPDRALREVPVLAMLSMSPQTCREKALALFDRLSREVPEAEAEVIPTWDEVGGGSLPGVELPGWALSIACPGMSARALEEALRLGPVPIVSRIRHDRVLLSPRTLCPGDGEEIISAFRRIVRGTKR